MNPFWNLVWEVPAIVVLGFGLSTLFPGLGYGRKSDAAPPYVGFDEDQSEPQVGIDYGYPIGMYFFDDPYDGGGYPQHGRSFYGDGSIPDCIGKGPHPGKPCGPKCWSLPRGNRAP